MATKGTKSRTVAAGVLTMAAGFAGCAPDRDPAPVGRTPSAAFAAGPAQDPAPKVSPIPITPAPLPPVAATPASCPHPPANEGDLRAVDVETEWRTVWVDRSHGGFDLLAAAPDGTLWTTFRSQSPLGHGGVATKDGGLRRWDGSKWQTFELPDLPGRAAGSVVALTAASGQRAWAFGNSSPTKGHKSKGNKVVGFVGTFQGGEWRSAALTEPAANAIGWGYTTAQVVGADRIWAVNGPVGLEWTGREWRSHPLPIEAGAMSAAGGQAWAVNGQYGSPAAMRWEEGGWRRINVPDLGMPPVAFILPRRRLDDVVVLSADDVWVLGAVSWTLEREYDEDGEPLEVNRKVALHWDGSWACHWEPLGTEPSSFVRHGSGTMSFVKAAPDGKGGLWAFSRGGHLWHLSGGRWTRQRLPAPPGHEASISAVALRPGTREVYAVGAVSKKGDNVSRAALWRTR